MNRRNSIRACVLVAILCAVYGFPSLFRGIASTSVCLFDINNGRVMYQWRTLGILNQVEVSETSYSKLLKKYGYETQPSIWKVANISHHGVLRWFGTQNEHEYNSRILADAQGFADYVDAFNLPAENTKEKLEKVRSFVVSQQREELRTWVRQFKDELLHAPIP